MEKEFVEPAANAALKQKWVEALRSGEFKQYRAGISDAFPDATAFCCVGVAAQICGLIRDDDQLPYKATRDKYGMSHSVMLDLFGMNDREWKSFGEIADWIETHDLETGRRLTSSAAGAAPTPLSE